MTAADRERTVVFAGDIDLTRSDELSAAIEQQVDAEGITSLTLDMTELTFLDSVGISLLLRARQLANDKQVSLTLRNPPRQTRRLLHLAGVAELFTTDPPADPPA